MDNEFLSFALGRLDDDGDANPGATGEGDGRIGGAIIAAVDGRQIDGGASTTAAAPAEVSPFGMVFKFGSNAVSIGRDPHDVAPPGNWDPYNPQYVAILYLKLESNWKISVNHASYAVGAGENVRLAKALAVISQKLQLSQQTGSDVDLGDASMRNLNPYQHVQPRTSGRPFDSGRFDDFSFGSQNEIFIFLHHPNMQIRTTGNALLGLKSGYGPNNRMYDLNSCFFHARTVPAPDMQGLDQVGTLIRLENWMTDQNGALLTAGDERDYSLDIMFQVDAGIAGWITMVVDPDTGNGVGYEP